MTRTVLLVHGAWLTPLAWEQWRSRYERRGYTTVAPSWPFMDRPVAELRSDPDPRLRTLSIRQLVDHYEQTVRELPEPPILIGHSFGGLVVALLLDRGLGAAGVAIDPAPTRGIAAHPTAVRTSAAVFLSWNGWSRLFTMSPESFATGFAQRLPAERQLSAYERHVVPAPGRIFFQGALGIGNGVNYANPHRAPLLLIGADDDRTIPLPMVRSAYRKHSRSPVTTTFQVFPNRSHFLIAEPRWEEIADFALDWAAANDHAPAARAAGELAAPRLYQRA
jgi:pimeloyl-ACP methyl ester carboxylesterase